MDYKKIYDLLIDRSKKRELLCYKERHHILPRCLGGSNDIDNLVYLTAREHFICHMLLCEIYPTSTKLKYALWAMCNQNSSKQQRNYKVSSRLYERLKIEALVILKEFNTGRKFTIEQRMARSKRQLGSVHKQHKSKELKFEHTCTCCNSVFKSADIKGKFCQSCKLPRPCSCGCGTIIKTAGRLFARGCKTRGKSYKEIYGTDKPACGFKHGNKFGKFI